MVAARRLIVVVVILDEPRCISRKVVGHTADPFIIAILIVDGPLVTDGFARRHPFFLKRIGILFIIEVAVRRNAAHIVHSRCDRRFDARIVSGRIEGKAAETADADKADAVGIDIVLRRKEVNSRREIFRADVRRGHVARSATAFPGKGRVKGQGHKALFGHGLGI